MFGWFRKDPRRDLILAFYGRIADASRHPWLYTDASVPDTVEGRLESLTIHAALVLRRLKALPAPADEAAQDFTDTLFQHIDHGLRELGVGDVVMPKRMKTTARSFYGRLQAYGAPLDEGGEPALREAFERNIPGASASALTSYALAAAAALDGLELDGLLSSPDPFAPARPPARPREP